ncbi:MAG: hypothetical protein CVT92_06675 [Bacteroidetes bacterium HGW-Bacteroidetes-1]|jgi:hypothetical protein|nr:MAG: hypothetical protein CVT92_06675 [Bacteroidetes bacterium HGW-Bacteroidetes-1]
MQKPFFIISIILFAFILTIQGQQDSYYFSRTIQKTFAEQTRSAMGLPAVNYWQNSSDYYISATLQSAEKSIDGTAKIYYFNNSPDTLERIVFNLYQDIFRKGNSRDWDMGTADLHDGMQIKKMKVDELEIDVTNRKKVGRNGTKLIVDLDNFILPHDSALISLEWTVKIPSKRNLRMGNYNDSTFFIAYWFPQIAVYDDIDGWDMISYNGSVEFYNDFSNFDVQLNVPNDFVVWATGLLQNPEEVLHPQVVSRFHEAKERDEVSHIIKDEDYKRNMVLKNKTNQTWHFKAENATDFSFGAGIGMLWDAVGLEIDSTTGRRIRIDAVYPVGVPHYENVAEYSRMSINYMSHVMPGIPFPYPKMTTFCSGKKSGGMETPMMANNGAPDELSNLLGLTFHEIAHSYMPFFMGTNEKKYAWMDEGWVTLWPHALVDSLFPEYKYLERTIASYENAAGSETDIPPMVPNYLLGANYSSLRLASYSRPAVAYYFLEDALGEDVFKYALTTYMNRWQGKHPVPSDFFRIFELAADQDLQWFFKPWFFENAYPDMAIRKITTDRKIVVENKGGLPLPVYLELLFTDGTKQVMNFPSSVWSNNESSIIIEGPEGKYIQEVQLGNTLIPDSNRSDNRMLLID